MTQSRRSDPRRGRGGRSRGRRKRRLLFWFVLLLLLPLLAVAGVAGYAWWETYDRMPVVRRTDMLLPDWPKGAPPVTVLLVSDSHVSQPDMPPGRLARIVRKLNDLHPDLVLLAGDYIGHKLEDGGIYDPEDAIDPFTGFHPPMGIVAVLGNHDLHQSRQVTAAMESRHIELLRNAAVKRGPLIIGGMNFALGPGPAFDKTLDAMDRLGPGPHILLTHAPDIALSVQKDVDVVLAGHTHCGQIVLPFHGAVRRKSEPLRWLVCGRHDLDHVHLVVTAGLGTSDRPLRFGADPDVWLIKFGPAQ